MANQPLNQNVFPAGFRGVEHQYETLIYAVYYAPRGTRAVVHGQQ